MYIAVTDAKQISAVAALAREIWTDHFGSMFAENELAYLMHLVQSEAAIGNQIRDGYRYFLIQPEDAPVGYFAMKPIPVSDTVLLYKLYLLPAERGNGRGRQVVAHLEAQCRSLGVANLSLTVYHKNTGAIRAYERMGFVKTGEIDWDVGNEMVVHDIEMSKPVPGSSIPIPGLPEPGTTGAKGYP